MDEKGLKRNGVYEYIAQHYYEMSREELKTLALEMFWQLEQSKGDYDKANEETIKVICEED